MTRQAAAWSERDLDRRFGLGEPHDELTRARGDARRAARPARREPPPRAALLGRALARAAHAARARARRGRARAAPRARARGVPRRARAGPRATPSSSTRIVDALARRGALRGRHDARHRRRVDVATEAASRLRRARRRSARSSSRSRQPRAPIRVGVDARPRGAHPPAGVRERVPLRREHACSVAIARAGATVRYAVADDGPGVEDDERERIFEPGVRGSAANGDRLGPRPLARPAARRRASRARSRPFPTPRAGGSSSGFPPADGGAAAARYFARMPEGLNLRLLDVLGAAADALVDELDADACAISRVIGDVLILVAERVPDGRDASAGPGLPRARLPADGGGARDAACRARSRSTTPTSTQAEARDPARARLRLAADAAARHQRRLRGASSRSTAATAGRSPSARRRARASSSASIDLTTTSAEQPWTSAQQRLVDAAELRMRGVDLDRAASSRARVTRRPRRSRSRAARRRVSTSRRPACRRAMPSSSRSSSNGSMRTFESEPMHMPMPRWSTRSTGRKPSPRFASVVGHAQMRAPACAEQVELAAVGVRRVHDRRARAEAAALGEQLDRAQAVLGEALLDLARLLVRVHVQRQAVLRRVRGRAPRASRAGRRARSGGRRRRGRRPRAAPRARAGSRRPTPAGTGRCRRARTRRRGARARRPPRPPPRPPRAPPARPR